MSERPTSYLFPWWVVVALVGWGYGASSHDYEPAYAAAAFLVGWWLLDRVASWIFSRATTPSAAQVRSIVAKGDDGNEAASSDEEGDDDESDDPTPAPKPRTRKLPKSAPWLK